MIKNEIENEAKSNTQWNLHNLPVEIILHICTFLDAKFIINSLAKVSLTLHEIFESNTIWKVRIAKKWSSTYPPINVNDDEFNWEKACIAQEEQWAVWSNTESETTYINWIGVHLSSIDAVHLINDAKLVLTGSRDRTMSVWDITSVSRNNISDYSTSLQKHIPHAHKGWVWDIKSIDKTVISASWDGTVKLWDAERDFSEKLVISCYESAALCIAALSNLVAVGTYKHRVLLFDPRENTQPHFWYAQHRGPVLSVVMNESYIISSSEDGSCIVWDLRVWPGKALRCIRLDDPRCFILSMSYAYDMIYMGDREGRIHLVDASGGKFQLLKPFSTGHTGKITSVQHNLGSIITSSSDHSIRINRLSLPPTPICQLKKLDGEVSMIHYQNNILAAGCTDALRLWIPAYHFTS